MAYDDAIQVYAVEHGLPDSRWFDSLVQAGVLNRVHSRNDPWGNPYFYQRHGDSYDLRTLGADGEFGTTDDQKRQDGWQWRSCKHTYRSWFHCR